MIEITINRGRCIGERTCGHCKFYLESLKPFLVMGGNYAMAVEDFERYLPEVKAAMSACEWGAIGYTTGIK